MSQEHNTELYLLLGEMKGMLSTVLSGLADVKEDQKAHVEDVNVRLSAQSARITAVERFQWKVMGIAAAAAFVIPITITIIKSLLIK